MAQDPIERNLGLQPLDQILSQHDLSHQEVVTAADAPLTHKTIQRARKGRRLKTAMQQRVTRAVNRALQQQGIQEEFRKEALFNY